MKKLYFAVATLAALSLASCTQKLETETSGSQPFEITVNAPTKTAVDADWNVTWEASDEIKAVINSTDVTFTNNGGNKFVTKDFAPEAGTEYSWSLLYHKDSKYFTAAKIGKDGYTTGFFDLPTTTVQKTASDKSHLGGQPLYGYATTTGTESPAVKMNHLTTVIVVKVTNSTSADLKISEIIAENDSDAAMSGTFYINCAEGKVKEKSPVTSVSMSVTDGTIAAGATAEFYIPAAPFTIAAGKNITITLKAGDKKAEFVKNISADKTFAAGKFNTTSVIVDAQSLVDDTIAKLTVAEFIEKKVSETDWYQLTGIVTNLINTTYGNFDLKDETGTVYIYGLTQTQVAKNDQSFPKLGIKEGDEVTIITLRAEYKGTAQGGGTPPAYYVSHKSAKAFTATLDKASVTSDAGTATIKITAADDVKWTITNDNETIFSLSETSGTGSKDVTVTYTANESTTDSRIANFVVSTSDFVATSSYSLKLTQAAVGAVPVETKTATADNDYLKGNQDSGVLDDVISYSNNSSSTGTTELRIYKGKTLTISAKSGYSITKVEFTCTANAGSKYGFYTNSTVSVDEGATATSTASENSKVGTITITGKTTKVAYKADEGQMRVTKMSVTYVKD